MPKSIPVSVRLSQESYKVARELARRSSRSLGAIVSELTDEALRIRRHPGIVFAGPLGDRRPRIEGSGLDVWEAIAIHRACDENIERTRTVLEHVSARQLEAALRYARDYSAEVDALIVENERSREDWERLYPHLAPASARSEPPGASGA
jgi:uncharacterized protein (DUF433 family)